MSSPSGVCEHADGEWPVDLCGWKRLLQMPMRIGGWRHVVNVRDFDSGVDSEKLFNDGEASQ